MLVVSNLSAANAVGSVSVCGVNKKKIMTKNKFKKLLLLSLETATLTD